MVRSDQDRHAKTLDIAQEEVLTCIGVYIYERLHKIHQKVRQVEQTWHLLFSLGVETLRKSFEVSGIDVLCLELVFQVFFRNVACRCFVGVCSGEQGKNSCKGMDRMVIVVITILISIITMRFHRSIEGGDNKLVHR